jgi:hypothetical protein
MSADDKAPEKEKYDIKQLIDLWGLDYRALAEAPGRGDLGGMTEARFVMQTKAAREAMWLSRATIALAVATVVLALATVLLAVVTVFK